MSASMDMQATGTAQSERSDLTLQLQPSVVTGTLRINGASVDGRDCWTPYLGNNIVSLRTKGDGACSIHALLGKPDAAKVLTHTNPRGWINDILSTAGSFSDLSMTCSTAGQEQVWTNVSESIGNELLLPWLRGDDSCDALMVS